MSNEGLKGHLDLLVLAALRDGPLHGYGLISELDRRSDGAFQLADGTIYLLLHRMEDAGLIRSRWHTENRRRRRVYDLTAAGKKRLDDETASWIRFARGINAVLGVST